ncbi:hypothetical protein [Pseudogemmobacter faecipullorum]|uniref:Uncharacterized protein n=1 Tax=Pseudogemmobacter faecipullorum TaxID=2755041 RepID=A0ABS8CQW2_9RHOB|nr:hypothetical protein [Pseudogemmobacter faecipullorum]MCB5411786.1 hypothetical protein [Pseudogemmobacter faecipullorum]
MDSEEVTTQKVIYATHPLRPELKREANANGCKIIDAAFAPKGERIMDGQTGLPVGEPTPDAALTEAQIRRLNKAALIAFLATKVVDAPAEATNADLIELALPFAVQSE